MFLDFIIVFVMHCPCIENRQAWSVHKHQVGRDVYETYVILSRQNVFYEYPKNAKVRASALFI